MNSTVNGQLSNWVYSRFSNNSQVPLLTTRTNAINNVNSSCMSVVFGSADNFLNQTQLIFGGYGGVIPGASPVYTIIYPNGSTQCFPINVYGYINEIEPECAIVPIDCDKYGIYFSVVGEFASTYNALLEVIVDVNNPSIPTIHILHQNNINSIYETTNLFAVNSLTIDETQQGNPRYLYTIGAGNSGNGEHKRLVRYTLTPNGAINPTTIVNNIAQGRENPSQNLYLDYTLSTIQPLQIADIFSEMELSPNGKYIAIAFRLRNLNSVPPVLDNRSHLRIFDTQNGSIVAEYSDINLQINGLEFLNDNLIYFNWQHLNDNSLGGLRYWNFLVNSPINIPNTNRYSLSKIEYGVRENNQKRMFIWTNPQLINNTYVCTLQSFTHNLNNNNINFQNHINNFSIDPNLYSVWGIHNVFLPEQIDGQDYTFNNFFVCRENIHIDNNTDWNTMSLVVNNTGTNPIRVSFENTTINFNQPIVFRNCNITVAPNAAINIQNSNVSFIDCSFRACNGGLWEGIRLSNSTLTVRNENRNAWFTYARVGIVCTDNSNLIVENARFRDNEIAIRLQQVNGNQNQVRVVRTRFTYNEIFFRDCPLEPGFVQNNESVGIEINNCQNLTIGDLSSIDFTNYFTDNLIIGIRATSFNNQIFIENNQFSKLQVGIAAAQSQNFHVNGNNFTNNWIGYLGANISGSVTQNNFDKHEHSGLFLGRFVNYPMTNMTISNNGFRNHAFSAIMIASDAYQNLTIERNNISNNSSYNQGAGITLDFGSNSITHNNYIIQQCTLSQVGVGIFANNFNDVIIQNNQITLSGAMANSNFQTFRPSAIFINRSNNFVIQNNTLEVPTNKVGNGRYLHGIAVDNTPFVKIQENIIRRFTYGIWLSSSLLNQVQVTCNQMENCENGMAFNYASSGLQFGVPGAPADNQWRRTNFNLPFNSHTLAWYTFADSYQYYARTNNPNTPNIIHNPTVNNFWPNQFNNFLNQWEAKPLNSIIVNNPPPFGCTSFGQNRRVLVNAQQKFSEKVKTFQVLTRDTSILPLYPLEQQFLVQYQNTNVRYLAELEQAIHKQDTLLADSLIQTIVPDSLEESDYKVVLCAEKQYLTTGKICDSTYQVLSVIASKHHREGFEVMQARYLKFLYETEHRLPLTPYYLLEVEDYLTYGQRPQKTEIVEITMTQIAIYPNPNKGSFFVEGFDHGSELVIYDLMGKEVFKTLLNQEYVQEIETDLVTGMYVVKVQDKVFKLIVE